MRILESQNNNGGVNQLEEVKMKNDLDNLTQIALKRSISNTHQQELNQRIWRILTEEFNVKHFDEDFQNSVAHSLKALHKFDEKNRLEIGVIRRSITFFKETLLPISPEVRPLIWVINDPISNVPSKLLGTPQK